MALGNRQLLGVFFVVVAMLGIFFAVGYIAGKSASPVLADSSHQPASPLIVDSVAAPAVETRDYAPKAPSKVKVAEATTLHPAAEKQLAVSAPVQAAAVAPQTEKPAQVVEKKEPVKTDSATGNAVRAPAEASGGHRSYLQLAATSKPDADTMVSVLRQKGFSTVALEIKERPGTWRVLVGPVNDDGTTLRADLQKMGFAGQDALRRTF